MGDDYHRPVLLDECIEGLDIKPDGIYVDATFGGGGHSKEILKKLGTGKLFAFDQDADAFQNAIDDKRFMLIRSNFRYMKNFLKYYEALPADGLLADLGISSHQIDEPARGFSTRFDSDLDMRMDKSSGHSAQDVIRTYSNERLTKMFRENADMREAKRAAGLIVKAREQQAIKTTEDLKRVLGPLAPRGKEAQFYSKVFQAIRIEVNEEIQALEELLLQSKDILKEGGRLVVISYHSLEDRLVKNLIKSGNLEGKVEKDFYGNPQLVFKQVGKPVVPTDEELETNSRSRSARLRIAERV